MSFFHHHNLLKNDLQKKKGCLFFNKFFLKNGNYDRL